MAEMFDLIAKFTETKIDERSGHNELKSSSDSDGEATPCKKVVYFAFTGDKMLFRMQILMDLYVIGKTLSKEQGVLQLFKMCDRLFHGFLNKMSWLLSVFGWLPAEEKAPLDNIDETFHRLQWHNVKLEEQFRCIYYTLDTEHLFSYMFSILLCILMPVQEDQVNQFLHVSFGKFNNCLELKANDHMFRLYLDLLCPPFSLITHYREMLTSNEIFEQELLNSIEYNAFANGILKEMCYHFLSIKQANKKT